MKSKNIINIFLGAILLVSSSFVVHAGCDPIADKNLQVADGMTIEQIRELIEITAASIERNQDQASIVSN